MIVYITCLIGIIAFSVVGTALATKGEILVPLIFCGFILGLWYIAMNVAEGL